MAVNYRSVLRCQESKGDGKEEALTLQTQKQSKEQKDKEPREEALACKQRTAPQRPNTALLR